MANWTDSKGRPILLREGTYDGKNGFGWIKIFTKHKILDVNSVRVVTQAPNGGVAQGNDRVYEVMANKMQCVNNKCKLVASVPVRAVVNMKTFYPEYYGVEVDGYLGVKTVYCVNDDAPAIVRLGLTPLCTTVP